MTADDMAVYRDKAQAIVARFDDQMMTMAPKQFSTGSVGWYANGKAKILVGETYLPVQVSLTLTIIGSKNFASQQTAPDAPESTIPALLGPEYPYNGSGKEGAKLGQEMASEEQKAGAELNGKAPKETKKGSKRRTAAY